MDTMNIFDYMRSTNMEKEAPLAARMRPRTLEEVVGQEHIIGPDKLLYRAIKADKISSVIFYGPPGTGKTTLAKVIANTTDAWFTQLNATVAGKKDMEEVVGKARDNQGMYGKRTILFIDEIHRFNKGQQDYLLPFVEDGTLILVGATTENPYFEVNGALLSRSLLFELKPLSVEAVRQLIKRAVYDSDRGMGIYNAVIEEDALEFLADISGGDARNALNAVRLLFESTDMMRQHVIKEAIISGYISDGGKAANIIPDETRAVFITRAPRRHQLNDITSWVKDCAKAAAMATRTEVEILPAGEDYDDYFTGPLKEEVMDTCFHSLGLEVVRPESQGNGSSDIGNVATACAAFHPCMGIGAGLVPHTYEFAKAMTTPAVHAAILNSAKFLLELTYRLFTDEELLDKIKKEHFSL